MNLKSCFFNVFVLFFSFGFFFGPLVAMDSNDDLWRTVTTPALDIKSECDGDPVWANIVKRELRSAYDAEFNPTVKTPDRGLGFEGEGEFGESTFNICGEEFGVKVDPHRSPRSVSDRPELSDDMISFLRSVKIDPDSFRSNRKYRLGLVVQRDRDVFDKDDFFSESCEKMNLDAEDGSASRPLDPLGELPDLHAFILQLTLKYEIIEDVKSILELVVSGNHSICKEDMRYAFEVFVEERSERSIADFNGLVKFLRDNLDDLSIPPQRREKYFVFLKELYIVCAKSGMQGWVDSLENWFERGFPETGPLCKFIVDGEEISIMTLRAQAFVQATREFRACQRSGDSRGAAKTSKAAKYLLNIMANDACKGKHVE